MSKKKSDNRTTELTRRTFIGLAGSTMAPLAMPILGYGLSADLQKRGSHLVGEVPEPLSLYEGSFFYGRQYFLLRSGRAKMILQADHADLGPAFTYLLFDAETPSQSRRKAGAFNFVPGEEASSSALQVEVGGFRFSALGQRTETRWVSVEGIPTVEAVWWAGGIKITEQFSAVAEAGLFERVIRLDGANLMGVQPVSLRLSLPAGKFVGQGPALLRDAEKLQLGLVVYGSAPVESNVVRGFVDIGPLSIAPQATIEVRTGLLAQIPAGNVHAVLNRTASLASGSAAHERRATAEAWTRPSKLSTGDQTIQDLFDHARYNLPGMIADDGSMDAGIFEYGRQWARDTSNSALGAIHAGYFELAHAALERVLSTMIGDQGATMVGSLFEKPDREELDQMGEILHALKAYRDWTGDESLIHKHRTELLNLIERPLNPIFRDETGLVHNRREYWERTFDDAYEMAYQTYLIRGLRDAADLAPALGAQDRAERWRQEADRTFQALLHHPTRALVDQGRLIKRRNVTGIIADAVPTLSNCVPGAPGCTEGYHRLMPDASTALPIALGVIDPASSLARKSLDELEGLWNTRWSDGGYDRYNTSSQVDQPGPWPFATCFILRAQHDAKQFDRSRRTLEWLNTVQGSQSGVWYEEIPSIHAQEPYAGLLPWTCAEVVLFVVRHWLGVQFRERATVIRPNLYPGSEPVSADLRLQKGRLRLEITGSGSVEHAHVNGRKVTPTKDGSVVLPPGFTSGTVTITMRQKA
ncbi:MAG TPA: hypothetical protein VMW54_12230 [Terriglobia bacterium]|nr:hypothetical protein [Terriglobia bacterium]